MLKKFTWILCLSAVLGLSACGEEKANVNKPVGLMAQESSDASNDEQKTEKTQSNQKSKKSAEPWSGEVVDINTASASELKSALKGTGVGDAKIKKIIEYREQNGGFKSVDELTEVKGIGDKTMEKLRERVTVSKNDSTKTNKNTKTKEQKTDVNTEEKDEKDEE